MITVATTFNLDRNPSSFFPMEIPRVSSADSPDPESRACESIDLSLSVHGFKIGDMVWGKVKSHPWWPGVIYNEAFATPSVRRSRQENHVLVAFFGDSSYGWFDPSELIPFSDNFPEKSQQTTLRSFLIAVEESVDEFSRRAALALTCKCRNPRNFRPRKVPNYFAVDVPGFECGGIYSADQIVRSREEFVTGESLTFVRHLALVPTGANTGDVEWTKRISVILAYRGAIYEEFDVPYAEAFGVQLESKAQDGPEEEPEKFTPRVDPFSGPLVTAEAGGSIGKKSSYNNKNSFQKHSSSSSATIFPPSASKKKKKKKNKYLLKKRDGDLSSITSLTLPDGYSQTVPLPPPQDTKTIKDDDESSTPPLAETEIPVPALPATEVPVVLVNHKPPMDDAKGGIGGSEPSTEGKSSSGGKVTKDKAKKKRPQEDIVDDNKQLVRKKKKIEELLVQSPMVSTSKKHSIWIEDSQPELTRTLGPNVPSISGPKIDVGPALEFPMLLDDLKVLAMEPYYGVDCDVPSVVGDVFLKFRSLVYEKSLVLPQARESDDQEIRPHKPSGISLTKELKEPSHTNKKSLVLPQARESDDQEIRPHKPSGISLTKELKEPSHTNKERKEQSEKTPKVKTGSLFNRSSDPAKSDKKRGVPLFDRQEEVSVKRLRKLDQLKSFANEKMAAATPPVHLKDKNAVSTPAKSSSSDDLARKTTRQDVPLTLPPKKLSPTNLILKFPPRSTLPSIANLKARFARFGQIIVDRCRVNWDTHSCRVQYKYKDDALEAYNYAKDNNLFGQILVKYIVRDVELPSSKSEAERLRSDSQPECSVQFMPGNGNSLTQSTRPKYNQMKPAPLKSILKKPGEDVVKENQRVKFKLAGDVSKPEMPSAAVSVSIPKYPSPPPPPPLSKPTAFVPTSLPRSSLQAPTILLTAADAFARPVPTQPQPASLLLRPRSFESRNIPSLTPLHSQVQLRSPPPVTTQQEVQQYRGGSSAAEEESNNNENSSPEVSHKMLSILHRCNDIVTALHSLPGFSPYRPL